jgi:hypothetical protein
LFNFDKEIAVKTKTINTGISLTTERMTRLALLAKELGVSRNEVVGRLIEAATVRSRPAVNVVFAHPDNNEALQGGVSHG